MPLIVDPSPEDGLGQGDILHGLSVYHSSPDGAAMERATTPSYLLVLSRNCNAIRDGSVLVAPIFPTGLQFSEADRDDFRKLRQEFVVLRDGARSPDRLYLGNIEGTTRFAAHLDEIYMLQVPDAPHDRAAFVAGRRVARLVRDQLFDLHSRLFLCFSRQGFNDDDWLVDEDLRLVLQRGTAQLRAAQAELETKRANLTQAQGEPPNHKNLQQKLRGLKKQIEQQQRKVEALALELEPIRAEAERRGLASDPSP